MENYEGIKGRVSVITPVYNGEEHLHRLLESVLAQTWEDIEMILVDDGSEDQTLEAAQAYQDQFRTQGIAFHIIAAEHRNASAAINRALPLVTGEFLIWPDSDDVLEADSIRKRAEFLRANPQVKCVRSLGAYRFEDGSPAPLQERRGCLENEELFFPILLGETFVCCGCYMLRCEAFFSIYPKRRIPEYDVGQNFQMLLPFMYFHRCPTIQEELYTVYVWNESHSRRILTQREEEKKYSDFESLVDEITGICKISSEKELLQVEHWKYHRRYALFLRHNRKGKALAALLWLWCNRGMGTGKAVKEAVKTLGGPWLRRLYRRFRTLAPRG